MSSKNYRILWQAYRNLKISLALFLMFVLILLKHITWYQTVKGSADVLCWICGTMWSCYNTEQSFQHLGVWLRPHFLTGEMYFSTIFSQNYTSGYHTFGLGLKQGITAECAVAGRLFLFTKSKATKQLCIDEHFKIKKKISFSIKSPFFLDDPAPFLYFRETAL